MGLYLEPPLGGRIQSKLDWLNQHGEDITRKTPALSFTTEKRAEPSRRYVFWSETSWGGNAAVAHNVTELNRLVSSGAFTKIFLVPLESLKLAGYRGD